MKKLSTIFKLVKREFGQACRIYLVEFVVSKDIQFRA